MRTRISCKQVDNLTPYEYNVVSNLAFHGMENSGLRPRLEHCRYWDEYVSYAYLLRNEDKTILSWALVYYVDRSNWHYKPKDAANWEAMFWTRRSHRGRGYGTRICDAILRDFGPRQVGVYPHDERAAGLFNKYSRKLKFLE
jgi:GNAT superfamily N-acetyltransferase